MRDGQVTWDILTKAGLDCAVAEGQAALEQRFDEGVGALVVTDITLAQASSEHLLQLIEQQPAWSDLPVLALCRDGTQSPAIAQALRALRNVTVLDRPVSSKALVSATHAALRGRRWQYQIRDQIEELMRAERALRQADQRKDEFLATLGHELRNPLSAIAALARVTMSREDVPGDVRERLAQMDRAAQRSLAMVQSLLDFSESRWRGALPTRPVLAELAQIAGGIIDELRVTYPDRVIALDVRSPQPFELDPARMEQVLSNLIGNAIVHGSSDTPVEVSVDVRDGEALLTVTNRGPVIPPEQMASLFQPFTQGARPDADQERPRGLGLGLFIVQEIVDAHGGTISVESSSDRGTTFLIRLPRHRP